MKKFFKYFLVTFSIFIFCSSVLYSRREKPAPAISGMYDVTKVKFDSKRFAESRKVDVKQFVQKAFSYLKNHSLSDSFQAFSQSQEFVDGEIYLFVYDYDGVCLANGLEPDKIWKNQLKVRDSFGTLFIKMMIDKAKTGGGWVNYQRSNATKVSFIKPVEKNGKRFFIGAGFYPLSKRDAVMALVKGAVEYFKLEQQKGQAARSAFSEFSYPLGRFIIGDLYVFALDFKGNVVAQGDRPGLIGTNALDHKDQSGKFINREIISKLKEEQRGVWIEYVSKGAPKLTYSEAVKDNKGKEYFIACGYYPETNRSKVVDLVKRGYTYMEKNGIKAASSVFSGRGRKGFRYGDLSLFVYDYKGKCVAHGTNRDFVGANRYDVQDQDGKYIVRKFIKTAKGGGGWIDYKIKNSYRFVYVEEVDVGAVKYVIGCGLYPISKPETMQLLVKGAAGYLRDVDREKAFEAFVKGDGPFVKGDIEIFVFDFSGICYAYGSDFEMIWKKMLDAKDDDGRPFVKLFINTAKQGSGTVIYKENGKPKTAYVTKVDKDGVSYVVGSSFFT